MVPGASEVGKRGWFHGIAILVPILAFVWLPQALQLSDSLEPDSSLQVHSHGETRPNRDPFGSGLSLVLLFRSCVALGKSLKLSEAELQFTTWLHE